VQSLNLVGSCAAESCNNAIPFFRFIQVLYNFVSSNNRWKLFTHSLRDAVPKSLSGTRWSTRSDATRALKENYERVYSVQEYAAPHNKDTLRARGNAYTLAHKMENMSLQFWA
jgi:hypothetical protein